MFKFSASGLVFGSVDFTRERIRKVVKYIYQNNCNLFLSDMSFFNAVR